MELKIDLPDKFQFLLNKKSRYKAVYGGRGSGKSESIARALIVLSLQKKIRILCAREYQSSINHSVHKLLGDLIDKYNLHPYFIITNHYIKSINGSEFIFKGITNDPLQIKSLQGVNLAWIEEAEKVTAESWDILTPTIRSQDSEIWVSFNPADKNDPTYIKFVLQPSEDTIAVKVNYYDNPFFHQTALVSEMEYDKKFNPEIYQNKWLGEVKQLTDALIFKGKYEVREFETADLNDVFQNRFFFGMDFGFSQDPSFLVRCYIQDNCLYVDYEASGVGIEMQQIKPFLLDKIPESHKWPIIGDSARPETISYIRNQGYNIKGCEKGKGSVEDGIEYLRGFEKIIIHSKCKRLTEEFGFYSYKVDRISGDILPVIVDKYNHGIDALRYSLNDYINNKSSAVRVIELW